MTKDVLKQLKDKRRSQKRSYTVFILLWISIIILSAWLSTYLPAQWDISREKRYSLTESSQTLLKKIDAEISFTHDDVSLEFIDPNQRPDLTREFGIRQSGEIRLVLKTEYDERSEILRNVSEITISNAIMRLSRSNERFVLFLDGHGERNPFGKANHDLGQFADELKNKGFALQRFNLSAQPTIPDNTQFIVIASPQLNYLPQEVERLQQYIVKGGSLLWFTEPDGLKGLDNLLVSFGLGSQQGTVIDPGTQSLKIGDASFSLISNYNNHPALNQFDLVTLLPQSRAFNLLPMDTLWETSPFLISSERTWLETDTLQDQVAFNEDKDTLGPLNLGMSLVRELTDGNEQRILILGDGDFLSNRFLHNGANVPLGLNLLDWLSGEEEFLDIRFTETQDVSLEMDAQKLAWLGLIFLILLPAFCFLIASRLWWKRRRG